MNRRLLIGMAVLTGISGLALGAQALGAFSGAGLNTGDTVAASTPAATMMLLIIGALILIELQRTHAANRRSMRRARAAAAHARQRRFQP